MRNFYHNILITLLVLLFSSTAALGQNSVINKNLASSLLSTPQSREVSVIITFADRVAPAFSKAASALSSRPMPRRMRNEMVRDLQQQATKSQQELRNFLAAQGIEVDPLWIINGLAIKATPATIATIAQWPGVTTVKSDQTISISKIQTQAGPTAEWNISAVGAPELWNLGLTGEGVVVASIDTGVDINHQDLSSKWRGPAASGWYDPNGEHATPTDTDGHGTSVMGVMVGGSAGGTAIGVAPDAKWIAAKIFNDAGSASYSAIHLAYQWLLDPNGDGDTSDAPDIVNNSWDLYSTAINQCVTEFQADIQALKAAGIAVVFAAGNFGPSASTSVSPANYPESLAVGATDMNNLIASESSRGPSPCPAAETLFPQIAAPGFHIKVTDLTQGGVIPDAYAIGSGTSLAAPHVSGLMALLLENDGFPAANVAQLETAIKLSSTDLGTSGPNNDYGYGLINGPAALLAMQNQPPAPATLISPTNGATDLTDTVIFNWVPAIDPEGNSITENVVLTEVSPTILPFFIRTIDPKTTIPLGGSVVLLAITILYQLRRRKSAALILLLMAGSLLLLNSCGGGGGGATGVTIGTYTATNLKAGTTYSWKVVSTDSLAASSESTSWQFTTR